MLCRPRAAVPPYTAAMTAAPWPDHLLTLDEWNGLPEDSFRRCELAQPPSTDPLHKEHVDLTLVLQD